MGEYEIKLSPRLFMVAGVLFMLTTSSIAVFFSYSQAKIRNEIHKQNLTLVSLSKEIEDRNRELENYNEHLEAHVSARTQELENQNKQLIEYAFINSHLLRAPLASILGIVNLLSISELSPDQEECVRHLKNKSVELDLVISKILCTQNRWAVWQGGYPEAKRK